VKLALNSLDDIAHLAQYIVDKKCKIKSNPDPKIRDPTTSLGLFSP